MLTLYHGTSAKYLKKILKDGLQPRCITKNSNYDGDFVSCPDLIYLTDTHPMFYAVRAAEEREEEVLILKVKVYERELFPDEDYVAQVIARQEKHQGEDFEKRLRELHTTGLVDPRRYKKIWKDSLDTMGTVACKPLPASRIIAHATAPNHFIKLGHFGADTNPPAGIGQSFIKGFFAAQYVPRIEALLKDGFEKTFARIMEEHAERVGGLEKLKKIMKQRESRE